MADDALGKITWVGTVRCYSCNREYGSLPHGDARRKLWEAGWRQHQTVIRGESVGVRWYCGLCRVDDQASFLPKK